jgi:hypothetical protein
LIVKVADGFPDATVTDAGGDAAELPLISWTFKPPVGAFPESVTVPVAGVPPVTELGFTLTATKDGGVTVKEVASATAPSFAEIVSIVTLATATVVTLNVWLT